MRKVLSIVIVGLILVSGMHLSLATHLCGGKVAAVKWSLTGQFATCGMEECDHPASNHENYSTDCCKNLISFFSVDQNYTPSAFQIQELSKSTSQFPVCNIEQVSENLPHLYSIFTDTSPPDEIIARSVDLAELCVFRI
jgi:hypothetical protein